VMDKIKLVETESWTWQQDYFESFVDTKTGNPVLRRLESYDRAGGDLKSMASKAQSCGIVEGDGLKSFKNPDGKTILNGEMGGNIEGLPGGICMIGDNQDPEFALQFCGNKDNLISLDVSWLNVGHVDELFKVIPTNRPGVPAECNFSLLIASPRKALELLDKPSARDHKFFTDFSFSNQSEIESFRSSRTSSRVGSKLCELYSNNIIPLRKKEESPQNQDSQGAKKAFYQLIDLFINKSHAGVILGSGEETVCKVETITNGEFKKAISESKHKKFNELVQKTLDDSKDKIIKKILERLPHCASFIQVVEVPDLFYGPVKVNNDGTEELARPGTSGSFMPNPTNSVVSNQTLILPDPQNGLFKEYLGDEMKNLGIKSTFIDTWDYSHLGDGNLHYSTHSIPYCRPLVGAGSKP